MPRFKPTLAEGSTPLDQNERQELIPDYISTQAELNQIEQENIADAFVWAGQQNLDDLLTATFLLKLHEKMFNQVWRWAGQMRKSNKNIGVMKEYILNDLSRLLGDTKFWIENKTYPPDELAARFHHRLVQIHIFPNGNGRHARLATDLLLIRIGKDRFTWGRQNSHSPLDTEGKTRSEYIVALKSADQGDFTPLLQFVRS